MASISRAASAANSVVDMANNDTPPNELSESENPQRVDTSIVAETGSSGPDTDSHPQVRVPRSRSVISVKTYKGAKDHVSKIFRKVAWIFSTLVFFATVFGVATGVLQIKQTSSSPFCTLNVTQLQEMQKVFQKNGSSTELRQLLALGKALENEQRMLARQREQLHENRALLLEAYKEIYQQLDACSSALNEDGIKVPGCHRISESAQSQIQFYEKISGSLDNPVKLVERSPQGGLFTRTTVLEVATNSYIPAATNSYILAATNSYIPAAVFLLTACVVAFLIVSKPLLLDQISLLRKILWPKAEQTPDLSKKAANYTINLVETSLSTKRYTDFRPPGFRSRKEGSKALRNTDVWRAAYAGDTTSLHWFLDSEKVDVNEIHPRLGTPLQEAAQGGHFNIVRILLKHGADPNVYGGRFDSPLQAAAYAQCLPAVRLLLNEGADVNKPGGTCGSALLAAAERGCADIVKVLLEANASVHCVGGRYHSVLQAAAFTGKLESVELLLDYNAMVNVEGGEYGSALQAAAVEGNLDIIRLLLDRGAGIGCKAGHHGTALQIACRYGHARVAETLVHRGADVHVRDDARRTPLHEAARRGLASLAKTLLEKGADPDAQDDDLSAALHFAALSGHADVTAVLLEHGANPSIMDKFFAQPLFRTAEVWNAEVARLLINAGADVNAADTYGCVALHCPAATEDLAVQELLVQNGADVNYRSGGGYTPLHRAVDVGNMANVKFLLQHGARTNIVDNDQNTALCKAIQRGHDEIARLLLQQPDVDVNASSGMAVQEAIYHGKHDLVDMMLNMPSLKINVQGGRFGSLVGAAASNGSPNLLSRLLDINANVNIQGGEHGTPVQAAVFLGHVELVKLLLDNGANVNTSGGRYGCVYRTAKMSNAPQARKDEIRKLLEGTGVVDIPAPVNHERDRWIITPSGWMWLPPVDHDQSYIVIGPRQGRTSKVG